MAKEDQDNIILSSISFTNFFWFYISLICFAICVVICWQGNRSAQASFTTSTSRPTSRGICQSGYKRLESIWSKISSKSQHEYKGWPAFRRLANRSKSQVGDLEMQRVQPVGNTSHQSGNLTVAPFNPALADQTLHGGTRGTRRLQRPANRRSRRSCAARGSAQAGVAEVLRVTPPLSLALPPRPGYVVIPELIAQINVGRIDNIPLPMYGEFRRSESLAPSILEAPPPTYAQHRDDEIAYLHDYQNPATAAEENRDAQGLPPYVPSRLPRHTQGLA